MCMSKQIILYYISCHVISYHIISYLIIYYIILYYIWEDKCRAFLKYHYYDRSYNPFLKIWTYCKYYVHIVFNSLISKADWKHT